MATIILATISVVLSLGALATTIAVAIKLYRKPNASTLSDNAEFELLTSNLADAVKLLKEHISTENSSSEKSLLTAFTVATTTSNNNIDNSMKGFKADVEKIATTTQTQLGEIRNEMKETMTSVRNDVTTNLTKVQENNEKQLEQMRLTVDEKLTSTLNTRIKNAFDTIGERLEAVQKGFGEMQSLSEKVGNLSKVFNNVKTTGNWGEVALETLLDQILAQEQYDRQVRVKKNSKEMVDFAIKMPGGAGKEVLLPIDAKFPTADFERLVTAIDTENADEIVASRKALYERVKTFAKDISAKYIDPPTTTNFAILYLPTEGLYAEIIRNGALCSELQNKHRITVCGPTTITALLNSLQIGFTTLKIQKKSADVVALMRDFQKDFGAFSKMLASVKDKANKVVDDLESLNKHNDKIQKRLSKVSDDLLETAEPDPSIATILTTEENDNEM